VIQEPIGNLNPWEHPALKPGEMRYGLMKAFTYRCCPECKLEYSWHTNSYDGVLDCPYCRERKRGRAIEEQLKKNEDR